MKQRRKNILLGAGLVLVMLLSIVAYSRYTQRQIHHESTQNLLSTYGQSAKTFTMFAQRNWNILNDWDSYLGTLAELGEQEGQWQEYIAQKGYLAIHGFLPVQRAVRVLDHRRAAGHSYVHEGGF